MGRAHERAEVAAGAIVGQAGEELGGVAAGIDDAERLRLRGEKGGESGVGKRSASEVGDAHAGERGEKLNAVRNDFANVAEAAFEISAVLDGGLGGGAKDNRGGVVGVPAGIAAREFLQRAEAGLEQGERERLGFVEDDDAAGKAVKFAAAAGLGGVERLEELNVGGDDDSRVPVFRSETRGGGDVVLVGVEIGVVLDHDIVAEGGKDLAEDGGVLLDDTGEREDVDDAVEAVAQGVIEGEGEGREGLAAAGGDGEREEAR